MNEIQLMELVFFFCFLFHSAPLSSLQQMHLMRLRASREIRVLRRALVKYLNETNVNFKIGWPIVQY